MGRVLPLEKWSPKELVEYYSNSFEPTQEFISEHFPQIRQALFRLGTHIDMKACWEKLFSTKAFLPNQDTLGIWLIPQIYSILNEVFARSDNGMTPQFKKKEVEKIAEQVNRLIVAIHNSDEALQESFFTVQNKLSEDIIKKHPDISHRLGFDVAPISSWGFISGVHKELEQNAKNNKFEEYQWNSCSHEERSAWLLDKVHRMDLTVLLRTYLEQLKGIPSTYSAEYIASNRSAVTKQLFLLMQKTYGEYMSDCVAPMVNAILDLELGIEDITPYKPK
jgi:hypothetical protein